MKIRAVMFDLGYTLWDVSYDGETDAYRKLRQHLVEALGEPVPEPQALRDATAAVFLREMAAWVNERKLKQAPTDRIFGDALQSLGLEVPEPLLRRLSEETLFLSLRYSVDPETAPALRALKERGLLLAAVSNTYQSRRSLERSLAKHGLQPYIDALVVSSEVGWEKPHAAIFQEALRRLGVAATETVFVGDIVWADVLGAQALGMKAVLTRQYRQEDPGAVRPDLVVERLAEVVGYVDRLNGDGS